MALPASVGSPIFDSWSFDSWPWSLPHVLNHYTRQPWLFCGYFRIIGRRMWMILPRLQYNLDSNWESDHIPLCKLGGLNGKVVKDLQKVSPVTVRNVDMSASRVRADCHCARCASALLIGNTVLWSCRGNNPIWRKTQENGARARESFGSNRVSVTSLRN